MGSFIHDAGSRNGSVARNDAKPSETVLSAAEVADGDQPASLLQCLCLTRVTRSARLIAGQREIRRAHLGAGTRPVGSARPLRPLRAATICRPRL